MAYFKSRCRLSLGGTEVTTTVPFSMAESRAGYLRNTTTLTCSTLVSCLEGLSKSRNVSVGIFCGDTEIRNRDLQNRSRVCDS
jgi:hypothetical protein